MDPRPPTLDDLVDFVGISSALLDKPCSSEHLKSISSGLEWRAVAPYLKLKDVEIDEIDTKKTEPEKRHATLQKWKRKFSFRATYRILVQMFLDVGNADHAEQVCRLLKSQGAYTEPREPEQPETPSTTVLKVASKPLEQPSPRGPTVSEAITTTEPLEQKIDRPRKSSLKVVPGVDHEWDLLFDKEAKDLELEQHQSMERQLLLELQKKPEDKPPAPKKPRYEQELPLFDATKGTFFASSDCMFIASVGSERPPGTKVVYKSKPSDKDRVQRALRIHGCLPHTPLRVPKGTEVDLVIVSKLMRAAKNPGKELVSLKLDLPGRERSKNYYLQEMKKFLKECKKPGAIIWYTGHSEQGTGNWCFEDGTISFQEIFDLYTAHFTDRLLLIVSDCCYSGKWVHTCAEKLDSMGIPPCGHKAREQGVMINIFASCQPGQKAEDPCLSAEGVEVRGKDQRIYVSSTKQLSEHQASFCGDFSKLVCCKDLDDACPAESEFKNWKWADTVSGEMWANIVFKRIRDSWYYVLLSSGDEEYRAQFNAQAPYTLNVADWGYVLDSGSGKDPPRSTLNKIRQWTGVSR